MQEVRDVVSYSYSGQRYVLGYGRDFIGIWARGQEDAPAFRFPKEEEGWRAAMEEFRRLEPAAQEVGPSPFRLPAPQPPVAAAAPVPAFTGTPKVSGLAIASLVVAILSAVVLWFMSGLVGLVGSVIANGLAASARKQITTSGGRLSGRGMAITAQIVAALSIVAAVIVIISLS